MVPNGGGDIGAIRDQIDVHLRAVAAVIRATFDRWSRCLTRGSTSTRYS
jgi:hypothetical protein